VLQWEPGLTPIPYGLVKDSLTLTTTAIDEAIIKNVMGVKGVNEALREVIQEWQLTDDQEKALSTVKSNRIIPAEKS
jgi:hypothetical protein